MERNSFTKDKLQIKNFEQLYHPQPIREMLDDK